MREILIILLALALVVLHLSWRRRWAHLQRECDRRSREYEAVRREFQLSEDQNRARLEALFNSMVEGVLVLDSNQRVRLINQGLKDLFNLSGDIQGRTIMEAFRHHELQMLVQRALVVESGTGMELNVAGPPARVLQANARVFRNPTGVSEGTIVVFHDLTRLKKLENVRQEFVANVSHELRTPLSMIRGYVETLLDGAKDDPQNTTRFLEIIQKHTNRLSFLIEDLLTISQLESGGIAFNFQPVDLQSLTGQVLDDLSMRGDKKKTTLYNRVPPQLEVRADPDRLQQVLYNLVDNAIKYGRLNGEVEVGAAPGADATVEVWVRDNGPGLPPDALTRVFERFYRVDRARSREQGGTGLGLAIVKHLVQSHGGKVWVKSEAGQGATFYFTLPAWPLPLEPRAEALCEATPQNPRPTQAKP